MGPARGAGHRRRPVARRDRAGTRAGRRAGLPRRPLRPLEPLRPARTRSTGTFDIVYTSRGVLGWLPDIRAWARVVAHFLAPGGTFFITEAHPVVQAFENEGVEPGELRLTYPYWEHAEPLTFAVKGSYADPDADVGDLTEHGWDHGLGEIVTALIDAGLRIDKLIEHPFLDWKVDFLVEDERQRPLGPAARHGRRAAPDVLAAGVEAGLTLRSRATPTTARRAPR